MLVLADSANRCVTRADGQVDNFDDLDLVEKQLRGLQAAGGFPHGLWPGHVEPLPMLHNSLCQVYAARKNPRMAARHGVQAVAFSRLRSGPEWVNCAFDLANALVTLAAAPDDCPLEPRLVRHLIHGHAVEIRNQATKWFGADCRYTAMMRKWHDSIVEHTGPHRSTTPADDWHKSFDEAQYQLFVWVGVDSALAFKMSA